LDRREGLRISISLRRAVGEAERALDPIHDRVALARKEDEEPVMAHRIPPTFRMSEPLIEECSR
jgi:hypothetical protein